MTARKSSSETFQISWSGDKTKNGSLSIINLNALKYSAIDHVMICGCTLIWQLITLVYNLLHFTSLPFNSFSSILHAQQRWHEHEFQLQPSSFSGLNIGCKYLFPCIFLFSASGSQATGTGPQHICNWAARKSCFNNKNPKKYLGYITFQAIIIIFVVIILNVVQSPLPFSSSLTAHCPTTILFVIWHNCLVQ